MSECSHAYTERGNACVQCFTELEAEVERLREAAIEYARCVSENIPRTSVAYEQAARNLGHATKEVDDAM